jgi:hypothetical protein
MEPASSTQLSHLNIENLKKSLVNNPVRTLGSGNENEVFDRSATRTGGWRLRLSLAYRAAFQPMRMVVTWAQITSQIGSVLHIHYPPVFLKVVVVLRPLRDFWSLFFDAECNGMSGFQNQWLLKVAMPLVMLTVAAVYSYFTGNAGLNQDEKEVQRLKGLEVEAFAQFGIADPRFKEITRQRTLSEDRLRDRKAPSRRGTLHKDAKSFIFAFIFMLYPVVVNTTLEAFECRDLIAGESGSRVLEADDRLLCDSNEVARLQNLSFVVIVMFAFGVPIAFSLLLILNAREYAQTDAELNAQIAHRLANELQVDESVADFILRDVTAMGRDFSFIMDAYSFRHYYWESLDLVRKLTLVGLVLLVRRGSIAQNLVALVLSFGFFALQMATLPFKLLQDNLFRAATEMHVFLVIVAGLALRNDLSGETIQEGFYDWGLFLSFLVLVPGAFTATVVWKVWSAGKTLSDDSLKGSFDRLRFGLASDDDRHTILRHVQTVRSSLGPLYEAGIFHDLDKPIEGAQNAAMANTRLCLGEYKSTISAEPVRCAIKIRPLSMTGLHMEAAMMTGSAVQHVNVCRMFHAAESDDYHYLAMQLCEATVQSATRAGSLRTLLGQTTIVEMLRAIAEGVSALHTSGFVHNNLMPSNVLLIDGVPKLSGFSSVAQVAEPMTVLSTIRVAGEADQERTGWVLNRQQRTGHHIASPYRAMEVRCASGGGSVESAQPIAADVYALGGIYHFVLTGGISLGH